MCAGVAAGITLGVRWGSSWVYARVAAGCTLGQQLGVRWGSSWAYTGVAASVGVCTLRPDEHSQPNYSLTFTQAKVNSKVALYMFNTMMGVEGSQVEPAVEEPAAKEPAVEPAAKSSSKCFRGWGRVLISVSEEPVQLAVCSCLTVHIHHIFNR